MNIFDYNSKIFTFLSICLMGWLIWNEPSHKPKRDFLKNEQSCVKNAKWQINIDPNDPNLRWYEKAALYLSGHSTKSNPNHDALKAKRLCKIGESVLILLFPKEAGYKTMNPIQVKIGNGDVPKEVDDALLEMYAGQEKDLVIGDIRYTLKVISHAASSN